MKGSQYLALVIVCHYYVTCHHHVTMIDFNIYSCLFWMEMHETLLDLQADFGYSTHSPGHGFFFYTV